ncbi:sensor histidine kinase [Streptomyces albus subsp. chlorinus]|uniref:sensor histidine kinase n=1 Tax=Streptomyces albus TaxID=1888 RepID=UPI00157080C6|nr:sensor histidine kinase [Streptomyces albus]NSC22148.1 sensor histidine kinase [Streptomyces albus subsp. chlorinus]
MTETGENRTRGGPWWWWERPRSAVLDAALAAASAAECAIQGQGFAEETGIPGALAVVLGVVAGATLVLRRRWPIAVVLVAIAVIPADMGTFLGIVGLYTLAATEVPRRVTGLLASMAACGTLAMAAFRLDQAIGQDPDFNPSSWFVPLIAVLISVGMTAPPVLLGLYVGARRRLVESLRERADGLERELSLLADRAEERAEWARNEERTRIAREMHDVVAHRVSLMVVHAAALQAVALKDPEKAARNAALVGDMGRQALNELRTMLGVLRAGDAEKAGKPGRAAAESGEGASAVPGSPGTPGPAGASGPSGPSGPSGSSAGVPGALPSGGGATEASSRLVEFASAVADQARTDDVPEGAPGAPDAAFAAGPGSSGGPGSAGRGADGAYAGGGGDGSAVPSGAGAGAGAGVGAGAGAEASLAGPSLAQLDALVGQSRAAGMTVELSVEGDPGGACPPSVEQTAYRVVQEALTNVHKHAAGAATRVRVAHREAEVALQVENEPAADGAADAGLPSGGNGLVGMRERVTALGGGFVSGPTDAGGFRVSAIIPYARR